ncbi:Insulinase (Peptidase M16) [Coelomomyces lativittatus]|nr:Insulinase (Peptidase M16) [Coelomomyces lativittatus]KAJ1517990.1 Insulinase (Peptidase M16) [Coelomomyces lativittatus]
MDTLHEPKFTSLRYKVLGSKDIQKPENDKREYKLVELENKLRVLLISDPQTDKAATALNVHVGYYSDPKNLPGLAHFLEHLLFMGTEKYPNENDYSEYLSRHHGSSNAYTSHSQTNYYFEVNSNFLHGALDRFSQFFIAPLFSESCTERELLAVDSEHKNNLLKDFWRLSQVHKSLCPQDHPYSKFGTGNLETLRVLPQSNGIVVRNELIQFYHRYYSANIMCLVILGKESLDTLLGWADTLFSSIQNKDVQVPSSLIRNHPWDSLSFKEISQYIHVKSLKDLKALLLTWKIPTSPDWWPQKPSSYITHLLGHEGKGSILSCLKLKDWAMNLVAYTTHDSMHFEFLKLQIDLTDEGMKNIEEIVVLVFQYLKLLKSSEPHEWIFNEMKTLREINFRFKEIRSMSNYALELASILHEPYPPHQLLNGQFVPFVWDSSLIKKCLSTLDTTFQITVSTANDSSVKYVLKEPYYGTEYRVDSISSGLIERINNCQLHPNLSFPKPNPFLPRKLEVKPHKMNLDAPEIVHETKHTRLWYLRDHIFLIPQAFLKLSFKRYS